MRDMGFRHPVALQAHSIATTVRLDRSPNQPGTVERVPRSHSRAMRSLGTPPDRNRRRTRGNHAPRQCQAWRGFAWHCGREVNLFGRQLGRILFVKPTLPQPS